MPTRIAWRFGAAGPGLGHLIGAVMDDGRAGQGNAQRLHDGALQISLGCAAARHRAALPFSSRWARRTGRRASITTSSRCASSRSAGGLAMGGEDIAGEPDQVVGMMRDIGDDGAGLGQPLSGPLGLAGLNDHHRRPPARRRRGAFSSCSSSHSSTAVRR